MSEWRTAALRDLGTWHGGGTPTKSRPEFWTGGAIPWLSPKDMGSSTLSSTRDHITAAALAGSAVKLIPAGSVAVVVRSGILQRTIPVALVPFETTLNQDMKAVFPRRDIDARWIAWGLRAREHDLLRDARKSGTTVASLEMNRFYNYRLPIPPIDEQRRIVDILEDYLSRIDAAQKYLDTAHGKARLMVAASAASHVTQARARWPSSTLGEHALAVEYGSSSKTGGQQERHDVPVLRMGNIQGAQIDWGSLKYLPSTHGEFPKLLLKRGDLLFNRTNSADLVGKSAVVNSDRIASFASYLIRVRFNNGVHPEWANLVINSLQGRQYIRSVVSQQVGQANVNGTKLKAFPLPLPSIEDQQRLVAAHMVVLTGRRTAEREVRVAAKRADSLRRALLSAAFSGKLTGRASDLDRIEEMAS